MRDPASSCERRHKIPCRRHGQRGVCMPMASRGVGYRSPSHILLACTQRRRSVHTLHRRMQVACPPGSHCATTGFRATVQMSMSVCAHACAYVYRCVVWGSSLNGCILDIEGKDDNRTPQNGCAGKHIEQQGSNWGEPTLHRSLNMGCVVVCGMASDDAMVGQRVG